MLDRGENYGQRKLLLVCLSYAGGGTAIYRSWEQNMPQMFQLVPICYSGREARLHEPAAVSWEALVDDCDRTVVDMVGTMDFVLFGHSMGALVAHELALRWARGNGPRPRAVILSEHASPDLVPRFGPEVAGSDLAALEWLKKHGNVSTDILENYDLRRLAVRIFRSDVAAYGGYRAAIGQHTSPVLLLHGAQSGLDDSRWTRWSETTLGNFISLELPGGHFYTADVWKRLPNRLAGYLLDILVDG